MATDDSILKHMLETMEQSENMTPKQIKIVEAAIELIAEKGYHATSTSEIAKRAGVAEGTIFRHYKTKKDLLVSIVIPGLTKFSAPFYADQFVEEVFQQTYDRFDDVLYHFIKNRFAFAEANIPLLKILLQELAFHPEIQEALKKVFTEKVYPALNKTIDHFKAKGQLMNIPNESIVRMIVPTILGLTISRFILQPTIDWDEEVEIKRTVSFIMNGIGKD
ncbi:TetR/AcrR family transcriptional regulator [Virgibacillus sp. W0181]|uniref:TetR/AcrR family transcriptional regulator n=1 Tax=Virgibacillus sp. W0181 TaxID=3391581 RepID=UPI003F46AC7D